MMGKRCRAVVAGAAILGVGALTSASTAAATGSDTVATPAATCRPSVTIIDVRRIPGRDLLVEHVEFVEFDNTTSVPATVHKTVHAAGTIVWSSSKPVTVGHDMSAFSAWASAARQAFGLRLRSSVTLSASVQVSATVPAQHTATFRYGAETDGLSGRQRITRADCRTSTTAVTDAYFPTSTLVASVILRKDPPVA